MVFVQVQCPDCYSTDVVQYGKQANGTQRYRCHNRDCPRTIFLLQYQDKGRLPAVRQQIVDMTLNGSGVVSPQKSVAESPSVAGCHEGGKRAY